MPSPRGKDSLHFHGKNIVGFMGEFEYFASHASLTDAQKCDEIRIYFTKKQKRVLDILDGFMNKDWDTLKKELMLLCTSSAETKTYHSQDIQKFTVKKRKIVSLSQ